ncbi:MAG: UMP kinase [Bacilli bacterium]|nr:uridylate kinase [Firmicutes bacterium CAG:345]
MPIWKEGEILTKYKRVLLKLSGEALQDSEEKSIFSAEILNNIAEAIKKMTNQGIEVAVVVGAGNIWRGKMAQTIGIEPATADYMGMLGTIINALALQSSLEKHNVDCRVLSAINVNEVAEPYIRRRALRHLEKKRVVIFAGGTGNPFFTTDTAAALRAKETNCDAILMAKNGTDGVLSADPKLDKTATLIEEITYREMLTKNLKVMDSTAVSLLQESTIEIRVFNINDLSNLKKVLDGEKVGTTIKKG